MEKICLLNPFKDTEVDEEKYIIAAVKNTLIEFGITGIRDERTDSRVIFFKDYLYRILYNRFWNINTIDNLEINIKYDINVVEIKYEGRYNE